MILPWLALLCGMPAWGQVPVSLPAGEEETSWGQVLAAAGLEVGPTGAGPWVRFENHDARWLIVALDRSGERHQVEVSRPTSATEREDVAWLAASLLEPVQSHWPTADSGEPLATEADAPEPPVVEAPAREKRPTALEVHYQDPVANAPPKEAPVPDSEAAAPTSPEQPATPAPPAREPIPLDLDETPPSHTVLPLWVVQETRLQWRSDGAVAPCGALGVQVGARLQAGLRAWGCTHHRLDEAALDRDLVELGGELDLGVALSRGPWLRAGPGLAALRFTQGGAQIGATWVPSLHLAVGWELPIGERAAASPMISLTRELREVLLATDGQVEGRLSPWVGSAGLAIHLAPMLRHQKE